jgi:hypothetical protein
MPGMRRSPLISLLLLAGAVLSMESRAVTIIIADGAPQIYLRVGQTGGTTNMVTFAVTGANAGNGTPIVGTVAAAAGAASGGFAACPANHVRFIAQARDNATANRVASLTVTSPASLTSGGGRTIPFNQIDWISTDAEIPSGTFLGIAGQLLLNFTEPRAVGVCKQFRFLNAQVYAAGAATTYRYDGTVNYTLSMP